MEQGNVEQRITWIENRMTEMEERWEKVDEIHEFVTRVRGGWSVIALLASIGVGAAIVMNAIAGVANWLRH